MPYPAVTFATFNDLVTYINTYIVTNGMQEIEGVEHNAVENGLLTFIRKSPFNWEKTAIVSSGGAVSVTRPATVFMTTTPTSLSWGDNIYNEFAFINLTANAIPLASGFVYYAPSGAAISSIPANSAVSILKSNNDLWVQVNGSGTGGGGSTQKQPRTFVVGTTANAPTANTFTWTLPAFLNSWVILVIARSIIVDMTDVGDGSAYIDKPIASDTLTINNYGTGWNTGDVLSYILVTP